jgi:5'-3' exonuclease
MGIKKFTQAFEHTSHVSENVLRNKTIAIDAMTEIFRASLGAKSVNTLTDKDGNSTMHISVILANIIKFQLNNIKQIWVFDNCDKTGEDKVFHNPAKLNELLKRQKRRDLAKSQIMKLQEERNKVEKLFTSSDDESGDDESGDESERKISKSEQLINLKNQTDKLQKRVYRVSPSIINDIKLILNCLNIQHMEAPEKFEGEHVASALSEHGIVDGVYSGDTDPIPFGAKVLFRRNAREKDKKIYIYEQADLLNQIEEKTPLENVSLNDLRKICVILGSDFSEKTAGIGPKTIFKKINDIELTDGQSNAIIEFSKIVPLDDIKIVNKDKEAFTNCEVFKLIDWLVNIKSFTKLRIENWFNKVIDLEKNIPLLHKFNKISNNITVKKKTIVKKKKAIVKKKIVKILPDLSSDDSN